ncbi:MAG: heme lyase CcmF/NrfE family subunit [Deltaproteobacteria bacterium]|nr:heme lyase CcmF/NrfE family subunit [Deltaproteobacteria bacterium]
MNLNAIGNACIAVSLAGSLVGMIAAVMGRAERGAAWRSVARICAYGIFLTMTIASVAMMAALITNDFSVGYVAKVGSVNTPRFIAAISLWSSLEGSILLWGWVLSGYTALCAYRYRPTLAGNDPEVRELQPLMPWVLFTLFAVGLFFYIVLAFPANPFFAVNPVPTDGPGPNPLLQNHWLMAVHPPCLYLGYVGMSVPFAFGIASIIRGDISPRWTAAVRRWTLVAWAFLSIAIVLGGWWSYAVLGWGGYWAWDPVENASFMPWLTGTAFLHSVMVQQRRQMLKLWNFGLIITTFLLTLLGTFLTRSGVMESVHAFTQSTIGHYFLVAIVTALAGSVALLIWQGPRFRTVGRFDHPICRESAILIGNLLFTSFCFVVLLGTLYPLIAEALRGIKVSVGEPFFNAMTAPLALALLLFMAIGVALPWQAPDWPAARRRFGIPAVLAVLIAVAAFAFGLRKALVLICIAVATFALAIMLMELVSVRFRLFTKPRRYGGFLAHIGAICIALGIAFSKNYQVDRQVSLQPGETMQIERYTLTFDRLSAASLPHRFEVSANVTVAKGNRPLGELAPRLNYYPQQREPIGSPAVRSMLTEDLYLTLMAFEQSSGQATIRALVTPAVSWIWGGGGIILLGVFVALRRPPT